MGEKGVRERDKAWLGENLYPWVGNQFGYEVALVTEEKEVIVVSPEWKVPLEDLPEAPWVGVYGDAERLYLVAFEPVTDNSEETLYGAVLGFAQLLHAGVFNEWEKALGGRIRYRLAGRTFLGKPSWQLPPDFRYEQGKFLAKVTLLGEEKELWGEFQIEKEHARLLRIYNAVRRTFLSALLLSVLLALFLSQFLVGWILRPLERLRLSAIKIGQGDYNLEFEVNRKDEVGVLSESFARMAEALRQREQDLNAEKRRAERMANLDALTHVPNRRFLEKSVENLIGERKRFALVFLDLDGFKKVNDLLGHTEGDHLLRRIALWFEKSIRKEDIVARYGGDEFCLLFPGLSRKEAEEVMERLLKRFWEKDFAESLRLSFSYGVAVYPDEGHGLDELLACSDREMYARKRGKASASC